MAQEAKPAAQSAAVAEQLSHAPLHSQVATEQGTRSPLHSEAVAVQESALPTEQEPLKRSKRAVETVLDVASLAHSTYEYNKNPTTMNAVFLAWDAVATVIPVVPGSYVAKAVKAGIEHAPDVGKAVNSSADFIVSPKGVSVAIPKGAHGPLPNINKSGRLTGFKFEDGSGGNGLHSEVTQVRLMDPIPSRHGKPAQPDGYAVYMNKHRQTINPYTGKPTDGKNDPWGHIPLNKGE